MESRRITAHGDGLTAPVIEFYPQVKSVHVAMIMASGALFALRGVAALAGFGWPLSWPARLLSYVIDTTLLAAAVLLLVLLPWSTFANGWLSMKLGLLVVYVAGVCLRSGRSVGVRWCCLRWRCWHGWMYTIARLHHPRALHEFIPEACAMDSWSRRLPSATGAGPWPVLALDSAAASPARCWSEGRPASCPA
jgi:uncharacterized membrane protein SirB2